MQVRCENCFSEYDEQLGMCPFCGHTNGEGADEVFCLAPGTIIADRYIIGELLGVGGFGITYKAWDQKLNTMLAIKEYYPSGLVNRLPESEAVILVAAKREREFVYGKTRFLDEARNMAKFSSHKNIVNVFDYFESNNTAYIVMEFLDGRTLSQILQQQNVPLPYDYCLNVASEVCNALRDIHKENILHRDVSPDNIMICKNGTVKLFDFGAARFSAGVENRVTVVVKPGFAPPEQYDKVNRQDPRTDIYALGATLYYVMTGIKPEESTNRKIKDTLVEPSVVDKCIPLNISTAIMRAMAIEQQYRFPNVDEFEIALCSERKVLSVEKVRAKRNRRRFVGILAAFMVVLIGAGSVIYTLSTQKAAAELPTADLSVWYIETGDEGVDTAKETALHKIVEAFTAEYSNVTVELTPVAHDIYSSVLSNAFEQDKYPDIFESTDLDIDEMGFAVPLAEELTAIASRSYYENGLCSDVIYPTSILLPVIYVNTTIGTIDGIENIDQLVNVCSDLGEYFEVQESSIDMYASLYGTEIADYASDTARDDFIAQNLFVYLGDSSDYWTIQSSLPGEYMLLLPETDEATYRYGSTWSVIEQSENDVTSAIALISYFDSEFSQDYFHIQTQSGNLPIIIDSMTEFLSVYDEFAVVSEYLDRPFIAPRTDSDLILENADNSKLQELQKLETSSIFFTDVAEDAWYAEAVKTVCARGLMSGTSDRTFDPDGTISKLSVVTVLYRLAGSPEQVDPSPFTDVSAESEQGRALAWAYEQGIVSATEDNQFHGGNAINLETAMVVFYQFAGIDGEETDYEYDLSVYPDSAEIDEWAIPAMEWGVARGLLTTQSGNPLEPKTEISRARFAVILNRLLELY